ncbi:TadE/TadG family type IV pilus assembly protein [Vibrio sp. CB1-14]|uniref:TadE/TadG family type IV pilus assembly protein n=1 Tax=Vibrio chaetopteri TaxID=3016528 RepID=A0AAU8BE01_9VIBR
MTVKQRKMAHSRPSLNRQRGAAAIWMGLTLVPIMGFTFWAVEGTRYVQETSRLRDAAEAAAIAVTIEDVETDSQAMAKRYVENYVRDIKTSSVTTIRTFQEQDLDIDQEEYTQYTVNVTTTHDSWFASTFIPSFDETQDLAGYSLARKYPAYLGDNNIDIVFVSDFSGSMSSEWGSGSNRSTKIDDLKAAIQAITEKVLCDDIDSCADDEDQSVRLDNKIGFVPYNIRTRAKYNNQVYAVTELFFNDNHRDWVSEYRYSHVDWNEWRTFDDDYVEDCADDFWECEPLEHKSWKKCKDKGKKCPTDAQYLLAETNQKIAKRVDDVLSKQEYVPKREKKGKPVYISYGYPDALEYVDFQTTVDSMFDDREVHSGSAYLIKDADLYRGFGQDNEDQFYNIDLTNDPSFVDKVKEMEEDGSTAVFQGVLRGFRMLNDGAPDTDDEDEIAEYNAKVKMILILSDGQESPQNGIFSALADEDTYDMCGVAREKIPGLYIGVIGIGYNAQGETGFQDCVENPSEDIINVKDGLDELIDKIEELIRKGSKSSGVTKLY